MEQLIVSAETYVNNFKKSGAEKIGKNVYKRTKGGITVYCIQEGNQIIEIECLGSSLVYKYKGFTL